MAEPTWRPHLRLRGTASSSAYTYVSNKRFGVPPPKAYPDRERGLHGRALVNQLNGLQLRALSLHRRRGDLGLEATGSVIVAEVVLNRDFVPETLENRVGKRHVELLGVRSTEGTKGVATLFIPDGEMEKPRKKVETYLDPEKDSSSVPAGAKTIQSIDRFRASLGPDLWTDPHHSYPSDSLDSYDWEVWLRDGEVDRFRKNAAKLDIHVGESEVLFPDRAVLVVRASVAAIEAAVDLLDSIAELRAAPQFDAEFHAMSIPEQADWTGELEGRLVGPSRDDVALCLLDSGVAWAHPLLRASLAETDCHACEGWTKADRTGHGTEMAGVASYGEEMGAILASQGEHPLSFRLESVKVIALSAEDASLKHRGAILREAPLYPEIEAPFRTRVFTMTVTGARCEKGRPTAWSGALDQICAGVDDEAPQRLVFISAGNHIPQPGYLYPEDNLADSVQDPAQAWNAVCVGAITHRDGLNQAERPGWSPLAPVGGLSPHTTTSTHWHKDWPNKPDMVMEGGNMATPPGGAPDRVEELELLTTRLPRVGTPLLTSVGGTSPAAVLAGRYAAMIQQEYTNLWPETVRALLIHSCRWTQVMNAQCSEGTRRQRQSDLLRTFGYGSPDLRRALHSAEHALTLVIEDTIQPFELDGSKAKTNELRLHELPWPESALESLGTTPVRLRVTLSYFVEPGPGERGWKSRYLYPSHNLRFAVKTASETDLDFGKRISFAERTLADKGRSFPSDAGEWRIGTDNRYRGSVHSDVWEGRASELTGRGHIAVYPVNGWWRTRKHLGEVERKARYSLVVSIETDEMEVEVEGQMVAVDLYSEVESEIALKV